MAKNRINMAPGGGQGGPVVPGSIYGAGKGTKGAIGSAIAKSISQAGGTGSVPLRLQGLQVPSAQPFRIDLSGLREAFRDERRAKRDQENRAFQTSEREAGQEFAAHQAVLRRQADQWNRYSEALNRKAERASEHEYQAKQTDAAHRFQLAMAYGNAATAYQDQLADRLARVVTMADRISNDPNMGDVSPDAIENLMGQIGELVLRPSNMKEAYGEAARLAGIEQLPADKSKSVHQEMMDNGLPALMTVLVPSMRNRKTHLVLDRQMGKYVAEQIQLGEISGKKTAAFLQAMGYEGSVDRLSSYVMNKETGIPEFGRLPNPAAKTDVPEEHGGFSRSYDAMTRIVDGAIEHPEGVEKEELVTKLFNSTYPTGTLLHDFLPVYMSGDDKAIRNLPVSPEFSAAALVTVMGHARIIGDQLKRLKEDEKAKRSPGWKKTRESLVAAREAYLTAATGIRRGEAYRSYHQQMGHRESLAKVFRNARLEQLEAGGGRELSAERKLELVNEAVDKISREVRRMENETPFLSAVRDNAHLSTIYNMKGARMDPHVSELVDYWMERMKGRLSSLYRAAEMKKRGGGKGRDFTQTDIPGYGYDAYEALVSRPLMPPEPEIGFDDLVREMNATPEHLYMVAVAPDGNLVNLRKSQLTENKVQEYERMGYRIPGADELLTQPTPVPLTKPKPLPRASYPSSDYKRREGHVLSDLVD